MKHKYLVLITIVAILMLVSTVIPTRVYAQTLTLNPASGAPGTGVIVTGGGYALNTAGWVWFDSNGNNVRDASEPQASVTTTGTGDIPPGTTLAVPSVTPGNYFIRADIPTGAPVEDSMGFTVLAVPSISLSPSSGATGTGITLSGSAFLPNTAGWLWFDSNGDGIRDTGEPQMPVTTSAAGAIPSGATLAIPAVAPGIYMVRADVPAGGGVEASASFTVPPGPSITLSPTSGASGTVIAITGSSFALNSSGWLWFDSNGDSIRDAGEPQVAVTTTGAGAIPSGTVLTAPTVAPATYQVRADIPSGGAVEASATFSIPTASISLSPTSGVPGTVTTVSGSGFTPNTAGWLWFDSNGDSVKDAGEPQVSVTTTSAGAIPSGATLTIPSAAPGTYLVRADIPASGAIEASVTFTVPTASISLSPTSGVPGTVITISGSGFTTNTAGWVWFDINRDSVRDPGEPQASVTTTSTGAITPGTTLTVSTVAAGGYRVLADIPADGIIEDSASFTVPTVSISLSPTSGAPGTVITITGSGFMPNVAGWVWFDSNGDGVRDPGERQVPMTTTAAGAIPSGTILVVLSVVPGTYRVLADLPEGSAIEASANFAIPSNSITLSPTSGAPGAVITITGSGFTPNTTGWLWFDINADSVRDIAEPQVSVTTTAAGAIPDGSTLTVPAIVPGTYSVRADIPTGGSVEASASFTIPALNISLSSTSGVSGSVITVTGSGFTPNTAGWLWFDINADSVKDAGEPQVSVTTTAAGAIPSGTILSVPNVTPADYQVRADIPAGGNVEASASFTVVVISLSLGSTSGAPGMTTSVSGGGFTPNAVGWVWFDSNSDSVRDAGEPQASVTTTNTGGFPSGIILTVPNVAPGGYQVRADIPNDGIVEASASFTVVAISLSLNCTSGAPGMVITVSGSGFRPSTSGWLWFDSNGDSVRDAGEPQVAVTTSSSGAIPSGTVLTVPDEAPAGYQVLADIPAGGSVEASTTFSILAVSLALSPASGAPGTVVTITGNGFILNGTGTVWFDVNGDGVRNAGEPQVSLTTTSSGFIPAGVVLTVPDVDPGIFQLRADIPFGGNIEASASFTITPAPSPGLSLSSAIGDIILTPGMSVEILPPGSSPFMGTICIQSTGLRYDVDIWTTTIWSTVVEAGARNASYAVSGFGLRLNNDTSESITVSYVVVYLRQ